MRNTLVTCCLMILCHTLLAQTPKYTYTIKADSVKITNGDSAELIIENHTQGVPGFLYNTGNGRTAFRRALQSLGNGSYLIGTDTLNLGANPWLQNGNRFGATGFFGTLDNYPVDFYSNNVQRARLATTGDLILGGTADKGYKMALLNTVGTSAGSAIYINPLLSLPSDRLKIGGKFDNNTPNDSVESVISMSTDSGTTYYNILSAKANGNIGFGYGAPLPWADGGGAPPVRLYPNGNMSYMTKNLYYGNVPGAFNDSYLLTTVSNISEWSTGSSYVSGQNYYYFGVQLGTPNGGAKRAPLYIGADTLHFLTGALSDAEALMISEGGNVVLGSTTDNAVGKLQVTGNMTATGSLGLGTIAPTAQLHTTGTVRFAGLTQNNSLTRVLVCDNSGNVYYKTTSGSAMNGTPLSSLAVNGTLSAERMVLTANQKWPDYVFDSTYSLASLKEVEKYIGLNKHLPGIPSAASVQTNGVDVGQTQAALLQKIEELTLYTINQDKTIEEKDKTLQRQKEEIESLKARLLAIEKALSQTK